MAPEKNSIIQYEGNQISLFSDERNDYINLTDMANAQKRRKSITAWLKNKQTLDFLNVWEKKHNPNYDGTHLGAIKKVASNPSTTLSIKYWIEKTNANGIFTRSGGYGGTYAHLDIAIKFAGWLSPEFELYLIEEIQRLKEFEKKKYSLELLSHDQIIYLVRLKEVFKYVAHQEIMESAHKDVFVARSGTKNPFAEFNNWRNEILDIAPKIINKRIKQYCIDNNIALTKKLLNKPKREKIIILDSYDSVRNATWDFLEMKGEVQALNLANLVRDMIKTEKGEVLRANEDDLFQSKQNLGEYTDFNKKIAELPLVKSARQLIAYRKQIASDNNNPSKFNKSLKQALDYNPNEDK